MTEQHEQDEEAKTVIEKIVYPPGIAPEVINDAPFTPGGGNNDGHVRNKYGHIVANTGGHEGMAQSIALLFNELAAKSQSKLMAAMKVGGNHGSG